MARKYLPLSGGGARVARNGRRSIPLPDTPLTHPQGFAPLPPLTKPPRVLSKGPVLGQILIQFVPMTPPDRGM